MLFNSAAFVIFFVIVYGLHLVGSCRWQNRLLLAASYVYYGFWDRRCLLLLGFLTLLNYGCGRRIETARSAGSRRFYLAAALTGNLGLLGLFKYFNFFIENLEGLFVQLSLPFSTPVWNWILPVGISFYTFQVTGYIVDVYWRRTPSCRNFEDFALFVAFFPQLLAGPIGRACELLPQFARTRQPSREDLKTGCHWILWGLFLKIFVADNLALAAAGLGHGIQDAWLGLYAYSFQIYGDFAGYSWMAVGFARLLGISLTLNFERPYWAADIPDFWRRWHISLSRWARDYVYIPLGGNRGGRFKQASSVLITMGVMGLWHGAHWNFVLFGLYHGTLILVFRALDPWWRYFPVLLRRLATFHAVAFGWIFFRAQTLPDAVLMFESLWGRAEGLAVSTSSGLSWTGLLFWVWPVLAMDAYSQKQGDDSAILKASFRLKMAVYLFAVLMLLVYGVRDSREFIYFDF